MEVRTVTRGQVPVPGDRVRLLVCLVLMVGCTGRTTGQFDRELATHVSLGMSRSDFMARFPDAVVRGARRVRQGTLEVLQVTHQKYSFFPSGQAVDRSGLTGVEDWPHWFYFLNDELIQHERPSAQESGAAAMSEARWRGIEAMIEAGQAATPPPRTPSQTTCIRNGRVVSCQTY